MEFACNEETTPNGEYCIFHDKEHFAEHEQEVAKKFEKKVLESISQNTPLVCIGYYLPRINFTKLLAEKSFPQVVYFNDATFYGGVNSYQVIFYGGASFDGATFSKGANFQEAIFSERADFFGATFSESSSFIGATFSKGADFREATFSNLAGFGLATFSKGADFREATFSKQAHFRMAKFSGETDFRMAKFSGETEFYLTSFSGKAQFIQTIFSKLAWFQESRFSKQVYFDGAVFSEKAEFEKATFSGEAFFEKATFSGETQFEKATFSREAKFLNATFSKGARFSSAKFSNGAYFTEAEFTGGEAIFSNANFSQEANFSGATFSKGAYFSGATFSEAARFVKAKFSKGAYFSGATFSKGAYFSEATFYELVRFIGTTFLGEAYFLSAIFTNITFFWYSIFEQPNKVIFNNSDLSKVSFADSDITRIKFGDNVTWGGGKNGFTIIEEELLKRKAREKNDAESKEGVGEHVSMELVLSVYRNLRENYEFRLRYDDAGKFFIKEMELKRNYRHVSSKYELKLISFHRKLKGDKSPLPNVGELIENGWFRKHLSLTGLYYHLSRYGESISRPTLIAVITVSLAMLFWVTQSNPTLEPHFPPTPETATTSTFVGFENAGDATQWLEGFERSLAGFLPFLSVGGETKVGIIDYLIKIFGGGLTFVLLAIALRRKFERKYTR